MVVASDQGARSGIQGVLPGSVQRTVSQSEVNSGALHSPVLITGATGFAGGHLVESLSGACRLVAWGRSVARSELAGLAEWQVVDLLDRDRVRHAIANLRPATIF